MSDESERALTFPVEVRFDGRDTDRHLIDMDELSRSLKGLSRIISAASHFASTHEAAHHRDAMDVRVLVEEARAGCYSFTAIVQLVEASPLLTGVLGTAIPSVAGTIISYIFVRNSGKKEEMKHLRAIAEEAIRQAGNRDDRIVERMLATIDRLADSLRPAARDAVAPVGGSAGQISIAVGAAKMEVGIPEAEAIRAETPQEVGSESSYTILLTELDMTTGSCRYTDIKSGVARLKGQITDPAVHIPMNAYVSAMASQRPLVVRAKPTLRQGVLDRLFISDARD
ncbi:DUF7946 domain-containing protein [Teichococcus aestuarii]|uniref:DUF7946 domain-containing protein n=1 Tax=Teichococcus aestuarii TaxID=568898 RepID=UPI00361279C9